MEGIQVSVEKVGPQSDISIIRVGGYIDTTTSSELERALDSLLKAGVYWIIIDLGNVDYISSAGWGIFISEIKGIRERGGDLKLAGMIPDVHEVFELLEFHYILKAFDSVDQAIGDFDRDKGVVTVKDDSGVEVTDTPETHRSGITDEKNVFTDEGIDEKVRQIAVQNPEWNASRIARELNTEKYGFIRLSSLSVRKVLRKLDLGNRKKRENRGEEAQSE
jgi:anti-sigma B factor antagonist